MRKDLVIAGVMSGSSLDGLDIAIVRFDHHGDWELLYTKAIPFSEVWVQKIRTFKDLSASAYIQFKSDFGYEVADLISIALKDYNGHLDYLSFHGHTLVHHPKQGVTEQIGNGGIIAAKMGIPTFTDFRIQDVAKGGEGTPLAPLVDLELFKGFDYYLNLGGIANISKLIGAKFQGYDICPCNQVLNHYSQLLGQEFDRDGQFARDGSYNSNYEESLWEVPYFKLSPPKSLDNNWIQDEFIPSFPEMNAKDILHTYCIWMSKCIAINLDEPKKETKMMVTGGGAHNIYFMELLKMEAAKQNCIVEVIENTIIDYKEAILMALMAKKNLDNEPNVLAVITGATENSIGGALYKP